MKQQIKEA